MRIAVVNFFGITPDTPGATKHYDMSSFFGKKKDTYVEFWINGINYHTDKRDKALPWYKFHTRRTDNNGVNIVYFNNVRHRGKKVLREINMLLFSFFSSIKLLFSRMDVVILSMPPVTNLLAWAAKIKGIKLIADVEDLWPLFIKESGISNKAILKYYDFQANSIYKHADGIEAVSNGMLEYVKNIVDTRKKVCWLAPLGVSLDEYDNIRDQVDLSGYKWADDFKVMYIGAHGRANDLLSVLQTIKKFNELQTEVNNRRISFVFIGSGEMKEKMKEYVENNHISNIYLEEPIRSSLVPYFLSQADVCITNLRRIECFKLVRPNKLFQYMAAEKPIICGIWGESEEIIRESESGICVNFTDPETASQRIQAFMCRSDLKEFGRRGNEYIRITGDREKIFEDFYSRILQICGHEKKQG